MSEPKIYAEGNEVFVAPVETERGVTLGFSVCICESEDNAKIVAKQLNQFDGLVAALEFALPHARDAWMKAVNNAPQGTAAYERWAAMPAWIKLDQGLKAAEAALQAAKVPA